MSKKRATKPTTKVQPGRCTMQRVQRVSLHFCCTVNTYKNNSLYIGATLQREKLLSEILAKSAPIM
jgi:hypothetical protein